MERGLTLESGVSIRTVTEDDHAALAHLVRQWWDERPPRVERLWFRHFAATTLVAETPEGRAVAIAVAFPAPGAARGVLYLVGVARGGRRRGLGRAIVAAAEATLREAGVERLEATVWPGNRVGVRFLEGLGYRPIAESLATPLFGVPAVADYDGEGEDRAVLERSLISPTQGGPGVRR